MRPIAEATGRVTGQTCSRKYIALGRIVNNWSEIVGPDLFKKAQPVKLRYTKQEYSKTPMAILDIACSSADATLLHYQKDLILERINQIFGEGWVTGIKFVASTGKTPKARLRKPKKPLTENEKSYLSGILETVKDEEIKARLSSLGQSILMVRS
jgi:hypothetical protein